MPEAVLEPGAEPLVGLVGDRGSVEGLRLLDGDLVLKIEYGGAAVQIGLGNVARFPDRLAQDLIMFIRQNDGKLPKRRREREFAALTDEEAAQIEAICEEVFDDGDG